MGGRASAARALTAGAKGALTWSSVAQISDKLIGVLRIVILARLLSPADFGIFAIAVIASSIVETLTQTGTASALMNKGEALDTLLPTAWILQIGRHLLIGSTLFAAANLFAVGLRVPEAAPVVAAFAIPVILNGFVSPGMVRLQRNLHFRRHAAVIIPAAAADLLVTIGAAVLLQSYWALVIGATAGAVTRVALSHALCNWTPFVHFDPRSAFDLAKYGRWIWATGIAGFLTTQADKIIVGYVASAEGLGIYVVASRIVDAIFIGVGRTAGAASFPILVKARESVSEFSDSIVRSLVALLAVLAPIATVIIIIPKSVVTTILGEEWVLVALPLVWLTIAALARVLIIQGAYAFRALGLPNVETGLAIVRALIGVSAAVVLGLLFGVAGVAAGVAMGSVVTLIPWSYYLSKITKLPLRRIALDTGIVGLAAASMVPFVYLGMAFGAGFPHSFITVTIAVLIGLAAYASSVLLGWRLFNVGPAGDAIAFFRNSRS